MESCGVLWCPAVFRHTVFKVGIAILLQYFLRYSAICSPQINLDCFTQ